MRLECWLEDGRLEDGRLKDGRLKDGRPWVTHSTFFSSVFILFILFFLHNLYILSLFLYMWCGVVNLSFYKFILYIGREYELSCLKSLSFFNKLHLN